jgi:hypothetical protein
MRGWKTTGKIMSRQVSGFTNKNPYFQKLTDLNRIATVLSEKH